MYTADRYDTEKNIPVILHIPHSAIRIPRDIRRQLLISGAELKAELLHMTDWYADELFSLPLKTVRFPYSRLVCDVERFREDGMESMAAVGMGAVYARTSSGKALRATSPGEREELLARFYDLHHRALSSTVQEMLDSFGRCLIIDCHSFASSPLPCEPSQKPQRPDICIGTDMFHTPPELADAVFRYFIMRGYAAAMNEPFSGAMVPGPFYGKDRRVASVMIEANRKLYMDEATGAKTQGFALLQADIRSLVPILDVQAT